MIDTGDHIIESYAHVLNADRSVLKLNSALEKLGYRFRWIICLQKQPKILIPEGKSQIADKTITYKQLLEADNYDTLVYDLIKKEVRNVMYKSMSEILDYLKKKLKLEWDSQVNDAVITANRIRNCCMHNNCVADKSLAKDPRFKEGQEIELSSGIIHGFGLGARQFTRDLWESATTKYSL